MPVIAPAILAAEAHRRGTDDAQVADPAKGVDDVVDAAGRTEEFVHQHPPPVVSVPAMGALLRMDLADAEVAVELALGQKMIERRDVASAVLQRRDVGVGVLLANAAQDVAGRRRAERDVQTERLTNVRQVADDLIPHFGIVQVDDHAALGHGAGGGARFPVSERIEKLPRSVDLRGRRGRAASEDPLHRIGDALQHAAGFRVGRSTVLSHSAKPLLAIRPGRNLRLLRVGWVRAGSTLDSSR